MATRVKINAEQIRDAVQRFKFDRFDPVKKKWEYYIQRFETELAFYNLLAGDATLEAQKKLLLSKVRWACHAKNGPGKKWSVSSYLKSLYYASVYKINLDFICTEHN